MGDEHPELVAISSNQGIRREFLVIESFFHVLVVNSPSLADAGAHHIVMFSVKDDVTAEEFSTLESSLRNLKQILGAGAVGPSNSNQPTKNG